jgi:hypothetical protein
MTDAQDQNTVQIRNEGFSSIQTCKPRIMF